MMPTHTTMLDVRGRVLATWVGYLSSRAGPGAGYLGWLFRCPLATCPCGVRYRTRGNYEGRQTGRHAKDPGIPSCSPEVKTGTRGNYEGRQTWRHAKDPGTPSCSPEVKTGTRGNYEGRQIGRHARDPSTSPPAHLLFFDQI